MKHYSKYHTWIDDSGDVGLTEYALEQLGEIVYVELAAWDMKSAGDEIGNIESVKSCEAIIAPVAGEYVAHKKWEDLHDDITADTALFSVAGGLRSAAGLMTEDEYNDFCEKL